MPTSDDVRPFECEVLGYTVKGKVTRPAQSEVRDYYVDVEVFGKDAHVHSFYRFRMIMVWIPARYSINLIENRLAIGPVQNSCHVDIPRDREEITFEKGITFCVNYHKTHFED
jgi:hypothetical protein